MIALAPTARYAPIGLDEEAPDGWTTPTACLKEG